jgi:dipeptidase
MCTRPVTARDERFSLILKCFECGDDILRSLHACRIGFRSDEDEVVVHHRVALHPEAFGDEFLFGWLGMHEHDVRVAAPARVERLTRTLGYDPNVNSGLRLEEWEDVAE